MCPASYSNTYKYRIYNVHEQGPQLVSTTSSSSLDRGQSLDRRQLSMYRSFSRPPKHGLGSRSAGVFHRSLSNEALNTTQTEISVGQSSQAGSRGMMSNIKDMLNRSHDGTEELQLDLTYITERIISMSFPSEGHETTYAFNLKDVVRMLKTKHGDNYLILNLSEKRQDLVKANPQVKDFGWPDHLAPPLERLCSVCKAVDTWLHADPRNVAVLHCKGGRARIAIIIAAYMHYSNICASADQALDRFAMKRFYDDKLGGLPLPSQRRYVHYFAGLLSGAIKINSSALYLHHLLIHGVPNFDSRGGCRPFIKVYQGMQPIFTSGVYNVTDNMQKVCISISPGIPLRGDILIKCYHRKGKTSGSGGHRHIIWQCQFHTCAVQDHNIVFSKHELDDAFNDPRFPDNGKVEFVFGPTSDVPVSVSGFKSDVTVPVDDNEDSLTRSDSYENFHKLLAAQGIDIAASSRERTVNGLPAQPGARNQPGPSGRPWDGGLYSIDSRQQRTEVEVGGVTQHNGPAPHHPSGSLASSLDSGYAGVRDTSYSSQLQQQHHSELMASTYSSQVNSSRTNYSSSSTLSRTGGSALDDSLTYNSVPRHKTTVPPLEERSQLDELLSDLLNDQVMVTSSVSPRSPQGAGSPRSPQSLGSPPHNSMKGAKTVTTTTHTHSTYSSTDSGAPRSPSDKVLIQRAEVTYKVPGMGEERQLYTIEGQPPEFEKPRVPPGAYSYTANSSSQVDQSRSFQSMEQDVTRSQRSMQQSRTQTLPYRTGYDSRYDTETQRYNTLSSDQPSWLQQQQQRLQKQRDVREETDSYRAVPMYNGPVSSATQPHSYTAPSRGYDGEMGHFSTYSQSQSQYYENRYGADRASGKPPLSPKMQRAAPPAAMPVQPPARSSSKDYMRSKSQSSSNLWQSSPPPANRPLARQYSDNLLDREPEPYTQGRTGQPSQFSAPSSPPHMGSTATTTYTTYRTIHKDIRDEPVVPAQQQATAAPPVQSHPPPPPQPQPPPQPAQPQTHHNYITEVFVHRVGAGEKPVKDKPDGMDNARLEELTRSLQAATESLMEDSMSSNKQQQSYQQSSSWQQHYHTTKVEQSKTEHNKVEEKREEGPPPKPLQVIEEDRIILRPIGPGMQTLEPEGGMSTLPRSATPSFPACPATPPFPASPATMQRSTGGTMTHTQQHQYHQQYQQQYQRQQAHDGMLHVDTSNRMLAAPNQARSPSSAGSPHSPGNLNTLRQELSAAHTISGNVVQPQSMTGQSSPSVYLGLSRRESLSSLAESDMMLHTTPRFVRDTHRYWLKPNITREDAIALLRDKVPGTFVIRESNSFPGAYGLAVKVAHLPANVQAKPSNDPQAELVRHFLIEPTSKGVRLRGCDKEPVFASLSALVYQHSITPLALPCKLLLPQVPGGDTVDGGMINIEVTSPPVSPPAELNSAADLLAKGAACNVIFLNTVDTESLTGPQAIAKAIKMTLETQVIAKTTVVHFKVSSQGVTLTDNMRKLFFRRHYPLSAVTYCGMDPQDRRWRYDVENPTAQIDSKIFGFVARKQGGGAENSCHLFAELDPEQPASAIVNFVTRVMIGPSGKLQS